MANLIQGVNDLATTHPELAKEWHPTKNGDLKPIDVMAGSSKKVWWYLPYDTEDGRHFDFEWEAQIASRVRGNSCPYLSNQALWIGYNDLATTNPGLVKEWHPIKNGNLKPTDVIVGSRKKVWWYLPYDTEDGRHFDFEWESTISDRILNNLGCPYLSNRKVWIGYNDLVTTHPELAKEWHTTKNGNLKPTDVTAGSNKKVWWYLPYDTEDGRHFDFEWESTITSRAYGKSGCPYLSNHFLWIGYNDLVTTHPELAKEWHPIKNGDLKPIDVIAGSNKKVWWYLPYDTEDGRHFDFEWESTITGRAYGKSGCPYLSNQALWIGYNDLATTHPELAKEWHPTKNGNLKPTDVFAGSDKKVWWCCSEGHEWIASCNSRSSNGTGCSYCSGRYVVINVNDLATTHPELAKEWHPTKNGNLRPTDISAGSHKKVWWYLPYDTEDGRHFDFEWSEKVSNRCSLGYKCPYLSNQALWVGYNDLATTNSELAKEWHPTKNGDLKPTDVFAGSNKKVWWCCSEGHEWKVGISHRNRGHNCPVCSNKKVLKGFNDLATTHPELVKEWHPIKNGNLKPTDVIAGSHKKVWWYLPYDTEDGKHFDFEWKASLNKRAYSNHGCPYLSSQDLWVGYNDLATTNPELAKEWHPTKNGDLKPIDVFAGSNKKVWWCCSEGHEWIASCNSRSGNNVGCPICNESSLEKSTRNILSKYGYNFTEQIKFDSLIGLGGNLLSFDFAINNPDGSLILVECQGEQHYRPVDYFGGKRQYKKQLEHDRLKQEFCEQNHILLIEIPYCYDEEDIDAIFRLE